MKRTKTMVTLLLLALLASMLPMSAYAAVSEAGQFPISDEPITIVTWIEGGADKDWTNNGYLQYLEELTQVRLEIIPSSEADARDKRNMLFASGDYPEMFLTDWNTMFTHADIYQFGIKEGMLLPINDFIDSYSVELKQIYERFPAYRQQTTAPDGNIYGVARFSQCYHCMAYPKFFMNMDWLKALNIAVPTNTEELHAALIAIRDGDPNGNGLKDEIPLTGATEWTCPVEWAILGMAYLPVRPDFWLYLESGDVKFAPEQDAYREGLRYIKSLYDEGLIDPAAFSQKYEQMRTLIRQEPYAVGA
ncbi:MAG TPA: extracellular solute-binding protein, partial [Clostridia bacterium]|nr:extracellular solute-binding protein [Clostridia bacterium]